MFYLGTVVCTRIGTRITIDRRKKGTEILVFILSNGGKDLGIIVVKKSEKMVLDSTC